MSETDKAKIGPVSKFSYLKELLILRVRVLIDSLPFTFVGYSRAKSILLCKFDKSAEIAAAHIQCIKFDNSTEIAASHIQCTTITPLPVIQN